MSDSLADSSGMEDPFSMQYFSESGDLEADFSTSSDEFSYSSPVSLLASSEVSVVGDSLRCPVCGKVFQKRSGLSRHELTHLETKPFPCNYGCGRTFSTLHSCQLHERQHSGSKPFMCSFPGCDKRFVSSSALRYHLLTHSGKKRFQCSFADCDRCFYSASNMKKHLRTHSGVKPHVCSISGCSKTFSQKIGLLHHLRIVHGRLDCDNCVQLLEEVRAQQDELDKKDQEIQSLRTLLESSRARPTPEPASASSSSSVAAAAAAAATSAFSSLSPASRQQLLEPEVPVQHFCW